MTEFDQFNHIDEAVPTYEEYLSNTSQYLDTYVFTPQFSAELNNVITDKSNKLIEVLKNNKLDKDNCVFVVTGRSRQLAVLLLTEAGIRADTTLPLQTLIANRVQLNSVENRFYIDWKLPEKLIKESIKDNKKKFILFVEDRINTGGKVRSMMTIADKAGFNTGAFNFARPDHSDHNSPQQRIWTFLDFLSEMQADYGSIRNGQERWGNQSESNLDTDLTQKIGETRHKYMRLLREILQQGRLQLAKDVNTE